MTSVCTGEMEGSGVHWSVQVQCLCQELNLVYLLSDSTSHQVVPPLLYWKVPAAFWDRFFFLGLINVYKLHFHVSILSSFPFLEADSMSGRVSLYTQHTRHEGITYNQGDTSQSCR